jgi:hypothetical protein
VPVLMLVVEAIRLVLQQEPHHETSSDPGVNPLRMRMVDDMRMRKFAPKTESGYLHAVRQFAKFLGRSPDTATVEDLRNYQLHLVDHGTSPTSLNAAISALKFFFDVTLGQPELMARMQPVRVPRKLPVVLSPEEVRRLTMPHSPTRLSLPGGLRRCVPVNGSCMPSAPLRNPKRYSRISLAIHTVWRSPASAWSRSMSAA